mgnify:CR=1 FL=1
MSLYLDLDDCAAQSKKAVAELAELRSQLAEAQRQLAAMKDKYGYCEQCDSDTDGVQFCAHCWNKLAARRTK